ncbi:hypothetical protein LCGC14_1871490 [marine sediment metagenome]|uniref:AAA+ ATPase domain-containing protein n=1 Tax=marine sediment metagenome TaxID=412755 RepID=A0A0F9IIY5_9ZZZZ
MKATQLATFLASAIAKRLPVLLVGPPGVGKTDISNQAAAQAGAKLLVSHPVVSDPTDAKGLPWVGKDGKSATFLPFGEMKQAIDATELTVWLLDDLGQAQPAVQASYMQLLLSRRINGHVLPDCVTFIAASNRRTDRAGVSGILEPVKSRFVSIITLEPSLDDWCQWAFTNADIPPELIAFLRFRPELLCKFTPSADLSNCPLPRTWHNAGKILGLQLPAAIEGEALGGAVGEGAAVELAAFLRMYRELPNIDAILLDPDVQPIPSDPAVLYAVVTGLAIKANDQNFGRIARYTERLASGGHGEFATLLIRDVMRKTPDLANTPEFARLASGETGKLFTGM